jgi:hypothetical protein
MTGFSFEAKAVTAQAASRSGAKERSFMAGEADKRIYNRERAHEATGR